MIFKNFIVIIFLVLVNIAILSQIPFAQDGIIKECDGVRFFDYCRGNAYDTRVIPEDE